MAPEKQDLVSSTLPVKMRAKDASHLRRVPMPSDDPRDPLNWPMYRKAAQYTTLTFTAFIMSSALSANQLAFNTMAKQFHKTPVQLSWTSSTAIGGQIAAPFVYPALFAVFGRSCVLFWSVLALLLCQVWSALLRTNFTSLILSRLLAGLVTSVPQVIGASFIMEAFFLHQRGKLYAIFELAFQFSISFGPMMGGFILNNHSLSWPWVFWWTCPLLGFCAILVVLFVHETNFDRTSLTSTQPWNESWLMNRVVTFLPGWKVVPKIDGHKLADRSLSPLIIAIMPVVIIAGFFNMITYGFGTMCQLQLTIWLQNPKRVGGYGFTPLQNALFLFTNWISLGTAELLGLLLDDSIPLWITRRRGGIWRPEYRLAPLILPGIVTPIGFAIYGSALQYHHPPAILALGQFLSQLGAKISIPILVNYAIECFVDHAVETAVAMNTWRLVLSVTLPFSATSWLDLTGPGWLFGTGAFLSIFAGGLVVVLAWQGPRFRGWSKARGLERSEAGAAVMEVGTPGEGEEGREYIEQADKR